MSWGDHGPPKFLNFLKSIFLKFLNFFKIISKVFKFKKKYIIFMEIKLNNFLIKYNI